MAAMNQLQQQFGNLQNLVQEQSQQSNQASSTPAPITSLHAAVEALANRHLEQQQMQQNFQTNVQHILDRLAQRSTGTSRVPIPQPLSTKLKGDDNELSYSDFKAKLQTAFARSPDSLTSDSWQHAGYLTAMLGFIDEDATRSVATFDILSPSERRLVLGTWNETSEAYSDHLPGSAYVPADYAGQLAYNIHTSGSTGTPKGVMIERRGALSLTQAHTKLYGLHQDSCILQFASCGFDASVRDILLSLTNGASPYLLSVLRVHVKTRDHFGSTPLTFITSRRQGSTPIRHAIDTSARKQPLLQNLIARGYTVINVYGNVYPGQVSTTGTISNCDVGYFDVNDQWQD
ncbi:hypothetical protein B0O80DRAFT_502980 [Mortierella sp. GBAus27b]|nr:hypothetical protein B0O80DRAFT_502980 [Mortierella sp. GBAus27b]